MTDVIAIILFRYYVIYGWYYAICGRWNGHCIRMFILVQVIGVKQNLISYMWQMVFANAVVKGWIVDHYAH